MKLHAVGSALFRTEADFGNKVKPWGMAGFSGWRCGSVQVGTRDQEVCVRLSSDAAARSWRQVVQHCQNVSRFDVQATVQVAGSVARLIDKYKRAARRNSTKFGDKRRVRWVQEHHGGYTLYLGNRQSNVFGRIYDKYAESKMDHYKNCVRAEAQFQYKLARIIAHGLYSLPSPMPRMASHLTQFFHGRDVDLELPFTDAATYCCSRQRSDVAKTLAWLQTSVRPSIMMLVALGHGEDMFRALGLISDDDAPLDQMVQAQSNN